MLSSRTPAKTLPTSEQTNRTLPLRMRKTGDTAGALAHFETIKQFNPLSHRAHKRWGVLRAVTARNADEFEAARRSLERAQAINPEATGVLLVLGEIELMRSTEREKDQQVTNVENFRSAYRQDGEPRLVHLQQVARERKNTFEALMEAGKDCSLGSMSHALYDVGGEYRRNM